MSKLRILYVASEINPFLQTSEVADFVRKLPQAMQEKGNGDQDSGAPFWNYQ
jgi:starch synthase